MASKPPLKVRRGALVVFEGSDNVGKTTQSTLLVDFLRSRGIDTVYCQFPNLKSTMAGKILTDYLTGSLKLENHVVHLLFSANRWEKIEEINMLLARGATIIMDRYFLSGIAYTLARGGVDIDWAFQADSGLPLPDHIFYLDGDHIDRTPDTADAMHKKVCDQFNYMFSAFAKGCIIAKFQLTTISTTKTPVGIAEQIATTTMDIIRDADELNYPIIPYIFSNDHW